MCVVCFVVLTSCDYVCLCVLSNTQMRVSVTALCHLSEGLCSLCDGIDCLRNLNNNKKTKQQQPTATAAAADDNDDDDDDFAINIIINCHINTL